MLVYYVEYMHRTWDINIRVSGQGWKCQLLHRYTLLHGGTSKWYLHAYPLFQWWRYNLLHGDISSWFPVTGSMLVHIFSGFSRDQRRLSHSTAQSLLSHAQATALMTASKMWTASRVPWSAEKSPSHKWDPKMKSLTPKSQPKDRIFWHEESVTFPESEAIRPLR